MAELGEFVKHYDELKALDVPVLGVRVDSVQYQDGYVSPHYDSMIAKLIVRGHDRAEAIAKMNRRLDMFLLEGIHTPLPLHKMILALPNPDDRVVLFGQFGREGAQNEGQDAWVQVDVLREKDDLVNEFTRADQDRQDAEEDLASYCPAARPVGFASQYVFDIKTLF